MELDFLRIVDSIPFMLKGVQVTLQIVSIAAVIGLILGIILSLCKVSTIKPLALLANAYTSVFRGTPLVLQLMLIYYGSPQLVGFQIDGYTAAILSFGLNSSAYISEIIRAGIQAVDKGQMEAATALGIPYHKTMKDLIIPQAMKNILPALMNEFITLTKESAIVTVIGVTDIMRRTYIVGSDLYSFFEPMLFAGLIYYVLVMLLTLVGKSIERKLHAHD